MEPSPVRTHKKSTIHLPPAPKSPSSSAVERIRRVTERQMLGNTHHLDEHKEAQPLETRIRRESQPTSPKSPREGQKFLTQRARQGSQPTSPRSPQTKSPRE